jgi:hypothetical protein
VKKEDLKILAEMGPELEAALRASTDQLKTEAGAETTTRMADRAEPPLPKPRAADGFLKGIQPIQYVG